MTLATPSTPGLTGSGSTRRSDVDDTVERELEALRSAMEQARHTPGLLDGIEAEFESFLAALTRPHELRFVATATSVIELAPTANPWMSLERASLIETCEGAELTRSGRRRKANGAARSGRNAQRSTN
jgi:hypothetical protein